MDKVKELLIIFLCFISIFSFGVRNLTISKDNFYADFYLKYNIIRIDNVSIGIYSEVNTEAEWKTMLMLKYRW